MSTPKNSPDQILLVGRRRGAIAAAKACGLDPVSMDVAPRREQASTAFGGSVAWAVEQASSLFPGRPPVAVVAVTAGAATTAAALRSLYNLPGISAGAAKRCHDKLAMKKSVSTAGIPCAPWRETTSQTTADELAAALGLPLVLKLPISSGGRGVWVCNSLAEVAEHLRPHLLAEAFTEGMEMSVETFRADGLTVFRNQTRYLVPGWSNVVPAELETRDSAAVDRLAERVHEALGINTGISHMEIFLSAKGPVFGEIAARPPGGYIMELMARAYGFDPWEALLKIATGQNVTFPKRATQYAGVTLLHPGAGKIAAIRGLGVARDMPYVAEVACMVEASDVCARRIGSGEAKGKVLVEAPTHAQSAQALIRAARIIQFDMVSAGATSDELLPASC